MYSEKYFKYKQKYLELKKMVGGVVNSNNYNIIKFDKIDKTFIENTLVYKVRDMAKNSKYLKDLIIHWSAELGFSLPWTSVWRQHLLNHPRYPRADARRVIKFSGEHGDNLNVNSLRFDIGLPSWDDNELIELDYLISIVLEEKKEAEKKRRSRIKRIKEEQ